MNIIIPNSYVIKSVMKFSNGCYLSNHEIIDPQT